MSDAQPVDTPLPAIVGDRYRIGRELGHGGMARVYLAHDIKHGREVAVKVIREELAASLGRERFLREIAIAARLRHPNIVPLYDSGDIDGTLFFVMPYETGQTLRARLAANGALPISDVVNILRDVARALQYAHTEGVVHRDIKPDNVLMSGGTAVVTDFGIAKAVSAAQSTTSTHALTQTGSGIGTPAYMSPEQAIGDPACDQRADVYSFGCMAYEMLAGVPPFHGLQPHQTIAAHMSTTATPVASLRADTPPLLAALVMQCLEKDPVARPQHAAEILEVLGSARMGDKVTPSASRRARWLLAGVAAVGVLALALVVWRQPSASTAAISVSVLPIANISGDTAVADFADGLSDEVFTALARVPGLQMRSRSGARNYHGKLGVDAKDVGRALHVDYIVTGAMRQVNGRWLITVELSSTADGSEVWSSKFDRTRDEQSGVAADIASAAVTALRARFPKALGVAPVRTASQQTTNVEAYRLYAIGQERLRRRGQDVSEGADALRRATQLDPSFAGAHAGLAMTLALYPYFAGVPARDVHAEVTTAAATALRLDSTLAQPHVALGLAYSHDYKWALAESEFQTALRLSPDDVEGLVQYGRYLLIRGRLSDASEQFQTARRYDPASAIVLSWDSYAYYVRGVTDSARLLFTQALQSSATNLTTLALGAEVMLGIGERDSARALTQRVTIANPTVQYVLAALGDTATAWSRWRTLATRNPPSSVYHTSKAFTLLGAGDTAAALSALEAATDAREFWPSFQPIAAPLFDGIRGSARLRELLRRVDLPPTVAERGSSRRTGTSPH